MSFLILISFSALIVEAAIEVTGVNSETGEVELEVKRLHSRRRRFIAPGARWDILGGVEVLYEDAQVRLDLLIRYELDYLFGGPTALAAAIAAAEAAAVAAAEAEAAVLAGRGGSARKRFISYSMNCTLLRLSI